MDDGSANTAHHPAEGNHRRYGPRLVCITPPPGNFAEKLAAHGCPAVKSLAQLVRQKVATGAPRSRFECHHLQTCFRQQRRGDTAHCAESHYDNISRGVRFRGAALGIIVGPLGWSRRERLRVHFQIGERPNRTALCDRLRRKILFCRVLQPDSRMTQHPPSELVAIAPVHRIGEQTLLGVSAQQGEEIPWGGDVHPGQFARLHRRKHLILLLGRTFGEPDAKL